MNYSRFQKIISSIVLFGFFFTFIFRFPSIDLFDSVFAENKQFFNIVSIIVDEEIYSDIDDKVKRYATDIQNTLENTKVVILPTPRTASAFDIASLNENLYFEGYNGLKKSDFSSKLIGTVLIGKLPLPIVYDGYKNSKTILPYVDFEDKLYVYNNKTQKYDLGKLNSNLLKPEIWHGVISPNSGDESENIKQIKDYFDKNHNFYIGEGKFKKDNGILNGKKEDGIPEDYEPYVFYFDQFRESQSLQYNSYKSYESTLSNKEDLVYNRFSKELAEKLKNELIGNETETMSGLIKKVDPNFDTSIFSGSSLSTEGATDIQSRYIIEKSVKKFLEAFNMPSFGKITEYVHNAGRYNGSGSRVNADMIPALISVLDSVSDEVVKSVNNDLENYIDNLVMTGGLSRKIAINTSTSIPDGDDYKNYFNYFYGLIGSDVKKASDCSIYLGSTTNSGKLVVANRGLNFGLTQKDVDICKDKIKFDIDNINIISGLSGYWAGNTPLNIDKTNIINLSLRDHNLHKSIIPLFDVAGSKEVKDSNKIPSPLNCFDNNMILDKDPYDDMPYPYPYYKGDEQCDKENDLVKINFTFNELYKDLTYVCPYSVRKGDINRRGIRHCDVPDTCSLSSIFSGVDSLKQAADQCRGRSYDFKIIDSYITHKSPTSDELTKQVASLVTPNLPVDKDRYIDFIGANGNYAKINYPYLFRVIPNPGEELNFESISKSIKNTLDSKSSEINSLIYNLHPTIDLDLSMSVNGAGVLRYNNEADIMEYNLYNKLKIAEYPRNNVNLYNYLKSKPLTTYSIGGEDKELSYYDTLAFSVYWNNLPSVSAKYKFIFENYLSDEFGGNELNYHLPKNKKQYEIAYLGAPGDSSNMYVKLDPEDKGENPYSEIISKNSELNTFLLSSKIQNSNNYTNNDNFKCGPPEGVPIWQWMGAISCRLKENLPPTVGISNGSCGVNLLPNGTFGIGNGYDLLTKEEKDNLKSCSGDINKNGINDCTESKLTDGKIELIADSGVYLYNKSGNLKATIKDKDGKDVKTDNNTKINFELSKINIAKDESKDLDETNVKTIFDKTTKNEQSVIEAKKYLNFTDSSITAKAGVSNIDFSTKNTDANIYFSAFIEVKDNTKTTKILLKSDDILVKIRGGNLFLESIRLTDDKLENTTNSVLASNKTNIYLLDSIRKSIDEVKTSINENSSSKEKLVLSLSNLSDKQTNLPISYPLTISLLYNNGAKVLEDVVVNSGDLNNYRPLFSIIKSGNYKIEIKDSLGYKAYKNIDIVPDIPKSLDIKFGTTITQAGGNITTHLVSILDQFGNIVSGNSYNIDLTIDGDGVEFDDIEGKKSSIQTFEGYRTFRLKSTNTESNSNIDFKLKDTSGNILLQKTEQIRTIKDLELKLFQNSIIKAGSGSYDFDLRIVDKNGDRLTGFNSRSYLTINKIYGATSVPYVDIVDGKAKLSFTPTGLAGQNIPIEFQVEGLNGIIKKTINIFPDLPMRIDMNLSKSKMEASNGESSILNVELKDRYGNLVFNDNSTTFKLNIEGNYNNIISSNTGTQVSNGGKATFRIYGKENPGTAYFKITTDPSISNNKVDIFGQAVFSQTELENISSLIFASSKLTTLGEKFFYNLGDGQYRSKFDDLNLLENNEDYKNLSEETKIKIKDLWIKTSKISVNGMSENVGKIETFYFWNKDKIIGKKYNSLYTTLFGASYGDITKQDYLAGSMLFDKENRALAVTTLLNEPFNYNDVININPNGALNSIYKGSDLSQDVTYNIGFVNNKLNIDLSNDATNDYIGKVYYNLDNVDLKSCIGSNNDFGDCNVSETKSSVLMKSLNKDYQTYVIDGKLVFKTISGKNLLEVNESGEINKLGNIQFEVDKDNKNKYLVLKLKSGNLDIGILGISLIDSKIDITKNKSIFDNNILSDSFKNSILVYIKSNSYNSRDIYSDEKNSSKSIYYTDPFSSSKKSSSDYFSKDNDYAIENFSSQEGIGWNSPNKFLLSFSAGENVGDSTKNYQSFSLINLGDPVISLKKIKEKFPNTQDEKSFDATVGKIISSEKDIFGYRVFDYNNDNRDDILLIKENGYLKLLENNEGDFIDKGNLAFISDIGDKNLLLTGDFNGDGYSDIFFVNDKQKPGFLSNSNKLFKRIDIKNQINPDGKIIQSKVFDMDNDFKDDIVVFDDFGKIYIFYGSDTSGIFDKSSISDDNGLLLDDESRNDNSMIYFDGLFQFPKKPDEPAPDKDTLLGSGQLDEGIIERAIFKNITYNTGAVIVSKESVFSSIQDYGDVSPNTSEVSESIKEGKNDLNDLIDKYGSGYISGTTKEVNNVTQTTFIKSEFSDLYGLNVDKKFEKISGNNIKSGDIVKVSITLTNTGSKDLSNIAYLETVPNIFNLNNDSIEISSEDIDPENIEKINKKVNGVLGYDFLIDKFSLKPEESLKITYTVKLLPITYAFLQVGLYESQEVGDDLYGDIILKPNNANCGEESLIYRSTDKRLYEKGTKKIEPDQQKIKLPDSIAKNLIDDDNNGVPDYVDEIETNTGEQVSYSTGELEKINKDTDNDGIPDSEDNAPKFKNEDGGLMSSLDSINQSVEDISEGIDNTIASLCNGFGSCFSMPMNWAPLAPGSDPVFMGETIGDGLNIEEGLPIFSAMTYANYPPFGQCLPAVWPPSPLSEGCSDTGAGGRLGVDSVSNFFRLYITPTITGAMGMAACFGGPASKAGDIIPEGISPLIPGGNCIYTAMPLPLCTDDGSEGDVSSMGESQVNWQKKQDKQDNNYNVINGNCSDLKNKNKLLNKDLVKEYVKSKNTLGGYSPNYKPFMSESSIFGQSNQPLIAIDGGTTGDGEMALSIDLDIKPAFSGEFGDVVKIKNKRTFAFPDFLMKWVEMQIEEIANKLTDFPTIFVILPDFSGIFNGVGGEFNNFWNEFDNLGNDIESKSNEEEKEIQKEIDSLNKEISGADCSGFSNSIDCKIDNLKKQKLDLQKDYSPTKAISSMQSVYDLLSNIPLIEIRPEIVNLSIPWVDLNNIKKTKLNWELTFKQWNGEYIKAKNSWTFERMCGKLTLDEDIDKCQKDVDEMQKILVNVNGLLSTLRKNIDTLDSYKNFPQNINKMLTFKETRLGQVVCNVETISTVTGGRIGDNGKRFKSWVELYVLIKAILESWQIIIDIFNEYQTECIACDNKRYTAMYSILKVISMIIPDIPIIQFPKWPDIIIDLHNIRVGLNIYIPEFSFTKRPIILPGLHNLYLPDVPNLGIKLPQLPLLPTLIVPNMPDLPTLPSIRLPDLPPPPKLPKILGAFSSILNIFKLVVKMMCILQSLPFAPEWRVGDQIAYMTSRTGFMPLDFLDLSFPQFSIPFVDAIELSSYINFEFGTDFITEMVRNSVSPLGTFTNDISSMTNVGHSDLDFRNYSPGSINVDIDGDGKIDPKIGMNGNEFMKRLVLGLSKEFNNMVSYIEENKDIKVDNKDFISIVNLALSSKEVSSNPKTEKLRNLWSEVGNLTYSKEDKKIAELQKNNSEKFRVLKDILNQEIEDTKTKKKLLEKSILKDDGIFKNISSESEIKSKIEVYNEKLRPYNYNFVKSAVNLKKSGNKEREELKTKGDEIIKQVNSGFDKFRDDLSSQENNSNKLLSLNTNNSSNKLLSATLPSSPQTSTTSQNSEYGYNYKGLYIVEDDESYRLFDYINELTGDEETTLIDYDLDDDQDLLYMVNNTLFIKQNLKNNPLKPSYVTDSPLVLDSSDNKFFNGKKYYEAINYFKQSQVSNGFINLYFDSSTDESVNNYRVESYKTIDKFDNVGNSNYEPINIRKSIIDGFSSIKDITISSENEQYTLRNNLGYISDIGSTTGLKLTTKSLVNIKNDISNGVIVNLLSGSPLYAGGENFKINYYVDGDEDNLKTITVQKYQNIEFKKTIRILGIDGDAYIEGSGNVVLNDIFIRTHYKKPILPGTKLEFLESEQSLKLNEKSHIDITYYDSSNLGIDFREFSDYTIYDLGNKSEDYSVSLPKQNGYNYSKIISFKNDTYSTSSNQELLSPQLEADKNAPELTISSTIKIPVYKKKMINLTPYIYEDSGLNNIIEKYVDLDLSIDSDNDLDPKNDRDTSGAIFKINEKSIQIEFGEFDKLANKNIGITLIDMNGNVGFKEVPFEVYSPTPEIEEYSDQKLKGTIGEDLGEQPIDLYRYRGGILKKIGNEKVKTNEFGDYDFVTTETSSGLILSKSGTTIATIDEYTGRIKLQNESNTNIKVNYTGKYPELIINHNLEDIYSQFIKFIKDLPIEIVSSFDSMTQEGIYIKNNYASKYNSYIIPKGVAYNPGTFVIYRKGDISDTPLISIFPDGRINLVPDKYYFDYENFGNYIVLNLKEKSSDKSIAEILFNVNGSYIMK